MTTVLTSSASAVLSLLAQADAGQPFPAWKPFLTPMPIWNYWFWLLLPLSLGVAIAYKTTKVAEAKTIPRDGLLLAVWIVGGLIAAAAAVAIVAKMA